MTEVKNGLEYRTAKELVVYLLLLEVQEVQVGSIQLFRKYLGEFARVAQKRFTTRHVGDNVVEVLRIK